ncbi:hypothetical protein QU864_27190, partial [Escherichia coli]|nr:hypothetical protein [Escherichia coli]
MIVYAYYRPMDESYAQIMPAVFCVVLQLVSPLIMMVPYAFTPKAAHYSKKYFPRAQAMIDRCHIALKLTHLTQYESVNSEKIVGFQIEGFGIITVAILFKVFRFFYYCIFLLIKLG